MAHKDIRYTFEVAGRTYEAVGFLEEGERSVSGYTALERVAGENGGAIGEEDWKFLYEHMSEDWNRELWWHNLVTNRRAPIDSQSASYFDRYPCTTADKWSTGFDYLKEQWRDYALVLRRCG